MRHISWTAIVAALLLLGACSRNDRPDARRQRDANTPAGEVGRAAHSVAKDAGKIAEKAGREIGKAAREAHAGWQEAAREDKEKHPRK